jgi:hypothetical protein
METADIMEQGLGAAPNILDSPEREVRFKGVERHPGAWVSVYEIQFWLENYSRREEIAEGALAHVWAALIAKGIYPADKPDPEILRAVGALIEDEEENGEGEDEGEDEDNAENEEQDEPAGSGGA